MILPPAKPIVAEGFVDPAGLAALHEPSVYEYSAGWFGVPFVVVRCRRASIVTVPSRFSSAVLWTPRVADVALDLLILRYLFPASAASSTTAIVPAAGAVRAISAPSVVC